MIVDKTNTWPLNLTAKTLIAKDEERWPTFVVCTEHTHSKEYLHNVVLWLLYILCCREHTHSKEYLHISYYNCSICWRRPNMLQNPKINLTSRLAIRQTILSGNTWLPNCMTESCFLPKHYSLNHTKPYSLNHTKPLLYSLNHTKHCSKVFTCWKP